MTTKTQTPEERIAELEQKLAEAQSELAQHTARDEGWLVKAPNPTYMEKTCGVKFTYGVAYVPKSSFFPAYQPQPMKESTLKNYLEQFPEKERAAERKAVEERDAQPSSERVVNILVHDFGYEAEFITHDNLARVKEVYDQRRVAASARLEEMANAAEEIMVPHYMG
jgi:hypothetical protein